MGSGKKKVEMKDFGDELGIILKAYERDLNDQVRKDIRACGRVALKEVKKPPPGAGKYHDWGREGSDDDITYVSGWHTRSEEKYGTYTIRIRNTKKPGLTHLLELGHLVHTKDPKTDGKKWARKFPHIAPAAKKAEQELKRRLGNG